MFNLFKVGMLGTLGAVNPETPAMPVNAPNDIDKGPKTEIYEKKPEINPEILVAIKNHYKEKIELLKDDLDQSGFNLKLALLDPDDREEFKKAGAAKLKIWEEIYKHPERVYEYLKSEFETEQKMLHTHFSNPEYLNKLMSAEKRTDAKEKQAEYLKNIDSLEFKAVTPDFLQYEQDKKAGVAYSIPEKNIFYFSLNAFEETDKNKIDNGVRFELLKSIYKNIEPTTAKFLVETFKNDNNISVRLNDLLKSPERLVYKKLLDLKLEELKIKKYSEEFTHEHYLLIMSAESGGKINNQDINDLLDTATEQQLITLMNSLA